MINHVIGLTVSLLLHAALALALYAAPPVALPPRESAVPVVLAMFEPDATPEPAPMQRVAPAPPAATARASVTPPARPAPRPVAEPAPVRVPEPVTRTPPVRKPEVEPAPARVPEAVPRAAPAPKPRPAADSALAVAKRRPPDSVAKVHPPAAERVQVARAPPPALPKIPVAVPPPVEPAATPAPPRLAKAAPPTPDPAAVADYSQQLAMLIARHRSYPARARMRHLEGLVEVEIRIAPGGRLVETLVTRSSGHELLDRQALQMVGRVRPLPKPPKALEDRTFSVTVPVAFRLEG